eukprot:4595910-Amphidinium_carterae.1
MVANACSCIGAAGQPARLTTEQQHAGASFTSTHHPMLTPCACALSHLLADRQPIRKEMTPN